MAYIELEKLNADVENINSKELLPMPARTEMYTVRFEIHSDHVEIMFSKCKLTVHLMGE